MSVKIIISREKLRRLYIDKGFSSTQLAKVYHCEKTAILNRLREYRIPLRPPKIALRPDKKILFDLYINQRLSPYKIAESYNCSPTTIRNWLKIYGFEIRKKNLIRVSKEQLLRLYFDKRFSLAKMGNLLGYSSAGILGVFRKYKIKLRTTSESSKYYLHRFDFDGDKALKAYMIGFRIGDLHVRKERQLIKLGSGTTKREQTLLFNDLFKKYGKVYIGGKDKRGAWHMGVLLNDSFSFLVPKHRVIPSWIKNNRRYFLTFVAGYTDAEGNIGCYPRARFKIASYDYKILRGIGRGMKKYLNIHPIYFLEKTDRTKHNQDALSLIINDMHFMHTFLTALIPYLRHEKRRKNAITTLESLKNRKHFNAKILYNN